LNKMALKKLLLILIIIILLSLFFFIYSAQLPKIEEKGTYSINFMGEKVGYEEYTWQTTEDGYILSMRGKMTKPVAMEISRLVIRLDKSFIPQGFEFRGSVSGVTQEIKSTISNGDVTNTILIAGEEQMSFVKIKRDAVLLPNPLFSPYMVLTKKYRCMLTEKIDISVYIIPQLEIPCTLEPSEDDPCTLVMEFSEIEVRLKMDQEGRLKTLAIPSQKLEVILENM